MSMKDLSERSPTSRLETCKLAMKGSIGYYRSGMCCGTEKCKVRIRLEWPPEFWKLDLSAFIFQWVLPFEFQVSRNARLLSQWYTIVVERMAAGSFSTTAEIVEKQNAEQQKFFLKLGRKPVKSAESKRSRVLYNHFVKNDISALCTIDGQGNV